MTNLTKNLLYLQMAALLVTAALAGPAASTKGAPFHGTVQGVETFELHGATLFSHGDGMGNATHLGRFTATWETVSFPFDPANLGSTTFHFVAANGERRRKTAALSCSSAKSLPKSNRVSLAGSVSQNDDPPVGTGLLRTE